MKQLHILIVFILLLLTGNSNAQYQGSEMLEGLKKKSFNFDMVNGFIVISANYANLLPLRFIVDTGASHNILFSKNVNDILGIGYSDTITIGGANFLYEIEALVARDIPISLKNAAPINRDFIVLEKNISKLSEMTGQRIDGILGGDFLRGLAVEFDFCHKSMILHDADRYNKGKDFKEIDITIKSFKPYWKTIVNNKEKKDSLNFLLDTGASLSLLIHAGHNNEFVVPENAYYGSLGNGISGELTGYVGFINQLSLGDESIYNVYTSFQEIDTIHQDIEIFRDGIIGSKILERLDIVIDYVKEKVYFKPNPRFNNEFKYNRSGMTVVALGDELNEYIVEKVFEGSPAYFAGVKPNDKIVKIGFWSSRFYDLEGIIKKLSGKAGKRIRMTVKRGEEKIKIDFRLEELASRK